MNCPDCDAMLTRLASLVLGVRKFAFVQHQELKHGERDWMKCPCEPCKTWARLLNTAGDRQILDEQRKAG